MNCKYLLGMPCFGLLLKAAILVSRIFLEGTLQAMSLELLRELLTPVGHEALKQRQFLHLPVWISSSVTWALIVECLRLPF